MKPAQRQLYSPPRGGSPPRSRSPIKVAFGRTVPQWLLLADPLSTSSPPRGGRPRTPERAAVGEPGGSRQPPLRHATTSRARKQTRAPNRRGSGRPGSPRRAVGTPESRSRAPRGGDNAGSSSSTPAEIPDFDRWSTIHIVGGGGGNDSVLTGALAGEGPEPEPEPELQPQPEPEPEAETQSEPFDGGAAWAAALALIDRSDWDGAVHTLTALLESSGPSAAGAAVSPHEAHEEGRDERAISPARCLQWRGFANDRAGRREQALADFESAIDIGGTSVDGDSYFNRGRLRGLCALRQMQGAQEDLRQAVLRMPAHPEASERLRVVSETLLAAAATGRRDGGVGHGLGISVLGLDAASADAAAVLEGTTAVTSGNTEVEALYRLQIRELEQEADATDSQANKLRSKLRRAEKRSERSAKQVEEMRLELRELRTFVAAQEKRHTKEMAGLAAANDRLLLRFRQARGVGAPADPATAGEGRRGQGQVVDEVVSFGGGGGSSSSETSSMSSCSEDEDEEDRRRKNTARQQHDGGRRRPNRVVRTKPVAGSGSGGRGEYVASGGDGDGSSHGRSEARRRNHARTRRQQQPQQPQQQQEEEEEQEGVRTMGYAQARLAAVSSGATKVATEEEGRRGSRQQQQARGKQQQQPPPHAEQPRPEGRTATSASSSSPASSPEADDLALPMRSWTVGGGGGHASSSQESVAPLRASGW